MKIKLYCDSGADITCLKHLYHVCEFYQYPYDSDHRPKKLIKSGIMKLAKPSAAQWRDANVSYEESGFCWEDATESPIFDKIKEILERDFQGDSEKIRRDILHIDSAYKTECTIFITSDNTDIASKRDDIEKVSGIKIFRSSIEADDLRLYIEKLK